MINIPLTWSSAKNPRTKANKISFLVSFFLAGSILSSEKWGYFCVPVSDLLLKPMHSRNIKVDYLAMNVASPEKGQYACPRVHQGLFNERVNIIQALDDERQVALTNCFFETAFSIEKQYLYWTHKDNIIEEEALAQRNVLKQEIFPKPISFEKGTSCDDVVTLVEPWWDELSGNVYSAGTRFKHHKEFDTSCGLGVIFYDSAVHKICSATIDHKIGISKTSELNYRERQRLFVEILRQWARCSTPDEAIAYVWGGVSWTQISASKFFLAHEKRMDQSVAFWVRPDLIPPCNGFDCSGIILRAAQIAGLPYYFKNTTTILHYLRPLIDGELLEEGDIIWCPGHVMVISDLENNLFVEARGYAAGGGRVLEASIAQRFIEISTYNEFASACRQHDRLRTKVQASGKHYKLLKLSSLWRDN